jgi:ribose transport system substrate-binding protein
MIMKTLVLAVGIVAGLAIVAPAMAQTKPTVAIIVKDTSSPYWQTVLAGARKAGQDFGGNVVELGTQSESDATGQIGLLKTAVASAPAAIIIAPAESGALAGPIEEAAKKVKVVGIESDAKAMTSVLASDNVNVGRIAADALAAAITKTYGDTEGNIVVITAMPGNAALDRRAEGFKAVLAAKYRALAIVADKVGDGKPATVANIMKDLIANTADLRGVFASDPVMTQVIGRAVAESKSGDKINVIGVGTDEKLVKLLADDTIAGLVVADPFRTGYDAVKTALAAARGEPVAARIDLGATLVTRSK